jgi:hypothetical protein
VSNTVAGQDTRSVPSSPNRQRGRGCPIPSSETDPISGALASRISALVPSKDNVALAVATGSAAAASGWSPATAPSFVRRFGRPGVAAGGLTATFASVAQARGGRR